MPLWKARSLLRFFLYRALWATGGDTPFVPFRGVRLSLSPPFCPLGATIRPKGNRRGTKRSPLSSSVAPLGQRSEPEVTTTSLLYVALPFRGNYRPPLPHMGQSEGKATTTTLSYVTISFLLPLRGKARFQNRVQQKGSHCLKRIRFVPLFRLGF